jgi:esterase/lipase
MSFRGRHLRAVAICALLLGFGLVALVPLSTGGLGSRPNALHDYETADSVATRRQREDGTVTAPGGSSLLLLHGRRTPRVVVLLHGFTNSPTQFALLARQLYDGGDNVYVPRLPHHGERGSKVATLVHLTAEELRDAADSAIDVAEGLGDSVVVVGLSAGGTMASWIAQNRADVRRVVIAAPVIAIAKVPRFLEGPARNLTVRLPNVTHADPIDARAPDREEGWTTHAVGQILRLGLAAQRAAVKSTPATRDVRILLNAHDRTISAGAALDLAASWAKHGAMVRAYLLADSLALPHDIIDPRQLVRRPDVVYPILIALAHGENPPSRDIEPLAVRPRNYHLFSPF